MKIRVRYIVHINFGYLLDLYVKTVAARFCTFPHCDRNVQMSTGNCLAMQGLDLVSCGPVQNSLVCCGHFDTGYANLRQPHILKG